MKKMELLKTTIQVACNELIDGSDTTLQSDINNLLELIDSSYTLVRWPDVQELMETDWFRNEAILALGNEDLTGSSAYFIPINRLF
jgi:hypothetical protein